MKLSRQTAVLLLVLTAVDALGLEKLRQRRQATSTENCGPFTLGTVISPLEESIVEDQRGFYLLPDIVPQSGIVLSLYTCAFLPDTSFEVNRFRFGVAPFRLVNDIYVQLENRILFQFPGDRTEMCMNISVEWSVEYADRLGVAIPGCDGNNHFCHALPTFRNDMCNGVEYNTSFVAAREGNMIANKYLTNTDICVNLQAVIAPTSISEACNATATTPAVEASQPPLLATATTPAVQASQPPLSAPATTPAVEASQPPLLATATTPAVEASQPPPPLSATATTPAVEASQPPMLASPMPVPAPPTSTDAGELFTLGTVTSLLVESSIEDQRGFYLLPDIVPQSGTVLSLYTCAFLPNTSFEVNMFRFGVAPFRLVNDFYVQLENRILFQFPGDRTEMCINISVEWSVEYADRLGVAIPGCNGKNNLCHALPTFSNDTGRCNGVQYNTSFMAVSEGEMIANKYLTSTDVCVNLQAVIALSEQMGADTRTILIGVFVGLLGVLVSASCLVFLVMMSVKMSKKMRSGVGNPVYTTTADAEEDIHPVYNKHTTAQAPSDDRSNSSQDRTAFRHRIVSEANTYSVIGESVTIASLNSVDNRLKVHAEATAADEYSTPFDNLSTRPPIDPPTTNTLGPAPSTQASTLQKSQDRVEMSHSTHSHDVPPFPVEKEEDLYDYGQDYWLPASEEALLRQQLSSVKVQEVSKSTIVMGEFLGQGEFAVVHKGTWTRTTVTGEVTVTEVAMKTLKPGATDEDSIKFLQEAAIMGQFKHPYIMPILGLCSMEKPYVILTELMCRDLRQHLAIMRQDCHKADQAELMATLLSYTRQIGCATTYLGLKSFIHRDIAARNILVATDKDICKIADFGMSRDLYSSEYYVAKGGKIPVKWTAPEALCYRKYSTASDIWSYGVLLFEIWSLGCKPYSKLTNTEVLKKVVAGYRQPPPSGCPRALYHLMIKCWHPTAESRPTCHQMIMALQQPEFKLLKVSQEDRAAYSEEALTLGSPVEAGEELYTELQLTYSQI